MTQQFIDAVEAFAEAIKSECERGHIADERGDIYSAANTLVLACRTEKPSTEEA